MKQIPTIAINTEDDINARSINMFQENVVNATNFLLSQALAASNLIEDIDLVSGDNTINHGLGRNLRGWFLTRKDADESVYDAQADNPLPNLTLTLVSTGDVTVSLIVF